MSVRLCDTCDDGIHEESELCTCEADVLATSKLYARELFEETITQVLEAINQCAREEEDEEGETAFAVVSVYVHMHERESDKCVLVFVCISCNS